MVERRAVVLLSGGLDSTTTAAIARSQGFTLHALTFDYGQRHRIEIERAAAVAKQLGVAQHIVMPVDLRRFGGSALTSEIDVPKSRSLAEIGHGIPVTYVPARNTIFLSFALAWAEALAARDLFIGVNVLDASGYPDCRPEYIAAYERMANLATKAGVEGNRLTIHTPLIAMTKADIVRAGLALGVDYSLTTSCYDPSSEGAACGACDACLLRLKGFRESGTRDPIAYRAPTAS
jgi:7-cyano-7-deazaguanine synthase